ncbi:MAG: thiolase family protein [Acidimicrobiaceae bacterium]|nr:thiolase family protein [Acidimicrobiaceae bacterium]
MTARSSFIYDAVRTRIGKYAGGLSAIRPDDLAATVLRSLVDRNPAMDPSSIDDVIFGNANGAGEENRNVARMAVLLGGLPTSVPGATVNRLCGSGMEAVIEGARAIETGDAVLILAGGVESMTRAPWVLPKPADGFARGNEVLSSTTLGWRLVNPAMPAQWVVSLGEGAEILADRFSIGRDQQDEFSRASHQKAAEAWLAGKFATEVVDVPATDLEMDQSIRPDITMAGLSKLRPVFRKDGSVTAGNASPLNDGASALILGDESFGASSGIAPLARIVSRAVSGVDPHLYGIGPVEAAERALVKAGIGWSDLGSVELNEAFASQSIACLMSWPDLDPSIVNPYGGAIAIGHPLGCSGARILTTLAHRMRAEGTKWGLAAMCIGVGQGIAVVLEGV